MTCQGSFPLPALDKCSHLESMRQVPQGGLSGKYDTGKWGQVWGCIAHCLWTGLSAHWCVLGSNYRNLVCERDPVVGVDGYTCALDLRDAPNGTGLTVSRPGLYTFALD